MTEFHDEPITTIIRVIRAVEGLSQTKMADGLNSLIPDPTQRYNLYQIRKYEAGEEVDSRMRLEYILYHSTAGMWQHTYAAEFLRAISHKEVVRD